MIQQPLKQYLKKLNEYRLSNELQIYAYNEKYELLKRDFKTNRSFKLMPRFLFQRYMNNTTWTMK